MIGQQLSHYRVLEKLGSGGMGEVFLAEDLDLERRVALKVLPGEMAGSPERLERFRREAKTLAALDHPAIVTIYTVEEADGVHFITMQLVEGRTLDQLIPAAGMTLSRIFDIALPLSDALAAAHEQGVTHRDLKPANVMVTDSGQVKVLDFGLAKLDVAVGLATDAATRGLTEEGQVVGTVPYMSPEQVSGQTVDQRSDIFSLGVVLYEMATGKRPFAGDTSAHLVSSILRDKPDSVTSFKADLPHHLGRIIHRCLEKEPRKRYQAALDVHNELEGLKKEVESGVVRTSSSTIAATPPARKPWWPLAAVAVAVVALAAVFWPRSSREASVPSATSGQKTFQEMKLTPLTDSGAAVEAAISPDGRYVAHTEEYGGKTSLHVRHVATGSQVEVVAPQDGYMWDPVFSPDGDYIYLIMTEDQNSLPHLYRLPVLGGAPQRILEKVYQRISFSPDGSRFAFVRTLPETSEEQLWVANADGSGARLVQTSNYPEYFFSDPSWWPGGELIAMPLQRFIPETRVGVVGVDAETGDMEPLTVEVWFGFNELAWYADGSGLVVSGVKDGFFEPFQIWEIGYPGGQVRRVTNDLNEYFGVSLTADGASLVTVVREQEANLWRVESGESEAVQLTRGKRRSGVFGVAVASDGSVLFTAGDGYAWVLPEHGGPPRRLTDVDEAEVEPRIPRAGRFFVYVSDAAGSINLWKRDIDGSDPVQLTNGAVDYAPALSPDGSWLVYGSSERLHRVAIGEGEAIRLSESPLRGRPAISPDMTRVAAQMYNQDLERTEIHILPFEGGEPLLTLDAPVLSYLQWAPDGNALIYSDALGDTQNLWRLPLDGGDPEQLTRFDSGRIWDFALHPDGGYVVSRGPQSNDVVLLENFR